jgi:hypothetical protein
MPPASPPNVESAYDHLHTQDVSGFAQAEPEYAEQQGEYFPAPQQRVRQEHPDFAAAQADLLHAYSQNAMADMNADPLTPFNQPRKGKLRYGVIIGAVATAVLLAWWLGHRGSGEVPVITADAAPDKVKPAPDQANQVPNQNVQIYDAIHGQQAADGGTPPAPAGTNPVPIPPQASPAPPSEAGPGAAPAPVLAPTADQPAPAAVPVPAIQSAIDVPPPSVLDGQASAPPETPAPTLPPVKATTAPSKTKTASASAAPQKATTGAARIQLGAVKSPEAAKALWTKLQHSNATTLGKLKFSTEKVSKNGQTFYRVQAGPFASRQLALNACHALKAKGVDCIVH